VTSDHRIAARAQGLLHMTAPGEPPVIEEAVFDPTVVNPPATFRAIATVSHPGGLDRIARVEVITHTNAVFDLFDDGTQGDEAAGDGRFTRTFQSEGAAPGEYTWRFRAYDRTGQVSEEVTATFVVP
jgi:hypothetical protein